MTKVIEEGSAPVTPAGAATRPKIFFPHLDGWRFLAFMAVYLHHGFSGLGSYVNRSNPWLAQASDTVLRSGWVGVSFFFVLSGFLITYLILSEVELTGKVDVAAFYVRRILRIWPLYYALLFIGFVIFPLIKNVVGITILDPGATPLFYVFFLSNFDLIRLRYEVSRAALTFGVTWSVAIEEQFYLLWPLLFALLPKRFYKYAFLSS